MEVSITNDSKMVFKESGRNKTLKTNEEKCPR